MAEQLSEKVTISNPQGLHARPAYRFAETASQYESKVYIVRDKERVDGKSILEIITLGAPQGTELSIEVSGNDAREALDALVRLVIEGFQDSEPAKSPK